MAVTICVSVAGVHLPALATCLSTTVADKILKGYLGHGQGSEKLDVYAEIVLAIARVEKPHDSSATDVPTAHTFTSSVTFDAAVAA